MIDPDICKLIRVEVLPCRKYGMYRGIKLAINDYSKPAPPPGYRRMYLKFSIFTDRYYLSPAFNYGVNK